MARLSVVETERQTAAERVAARIAAEEDRDLLRFLTCGSVDDGKSTLIGRLLYDSSLVYEDQMRSVEHDSRRPGGGREGVLDLSLLIDGLQAEREQKITIDVAYRYFSTPRRKFIVADTPGHVQYTRNMATGASNCDFAVLLVDARSGVLTQTRRHACILSLLGIKKVALAVNKMDLVDFDPARFEAVAEEFANFAAPLGFEHITAIPVSALKGDNVISPSAARRRTSSIMPSPMRARRWRASWPRARPSAGCWSCWPRSLPWRGRRGASRSTTTATSRARTRSAP